MSDPLKHYLWTLSPEEKFEHSIAAAASLAWGKHQGWETVCCLSALKKNQTKKIKSFGQHCNMLHVFCWRQRSQNRPFFMLIWETEYRKELCCFILYVCVCFALLWKRLQFFCLCRWGKCHACYLDTFLQCCFNSVSSDALRSLWWSIREVVVSGALQAQVSCWKFSFRRCSLKCVFYLVLIVYLFFMLWGADRKRPSLLRLEFSSCRHEMKIILTGAAQAGKVYGVSFFLLIEVMKAMERCACAGARRMI